jgi:hydroxyethylthiazole kinase-like uncharacterized protein yjeF
VLSNVRVTTTAQIRALEKAWIESANEVPGTNWSQVLMEVAGRGAALAALSIWHEDAVAGGDLVVICGRGNNGGDGLVVARYLSLWGLPVICFVLAAEPAKSQTMASVESETNLQLLKKTDAEIVYLDEKEHEGGELDARLTSALQHGSLIVDAIFGTGLNRPVDGFAREIIEAVNNSLKPVIAVDIASGVNSDSGQIMGSAIRAIKTVTFGYLKPGQLQYPGTAQGGDLQLIDIGLPDIDFLERSQGKPQETSEPQIFVTTCGAVQSVLPHRPHNSNKGTFGNLLTIAGSLGMSGSGILCASSALRTGAGLSYVATAKSLVANLPAEELVYKALSETTAQSISHEALKEVTHLLETVSAVVLGPGLSQNPDTVSFILDLLDLIDKPCVLDADALNALSQNPQSLSKPARNFVMTPHPKELSRLTGKSVAELSADRIKCCLEAAKQFDCVVVLKGSYTVVGSPDGIAYLNPTGNSGMSTAGAGDVLSGIIGGLLAQGLSPIDAATAGVYLHGKAGDIAANTLGKAGLIAGDISAAIPVGLTVIKSGELSHLEDLLSQAAANQ